MMHTISDTLDPILADPLALARRSTKPLAYVGNDIPPDLALASERLFCHLPWQSGRPTPWADRWLESAFPGWARSMLEDWANGAFDFFEAVIFSRGDDAAQRLYYYICELQRRGHLSGPRALILDVSKVPRQSSIHHCRQALVTLLDELDMDAGTLAQGIEAANLRRRWYQDLLQVPALPGQLMENLARAVLFQDVYQQLGELPLPSAPTTQLPLLLGGSAPPDDRFHRAAEAVGWNVCGELHQRSLARYGLPINDYGSDALSALAQHLHGNAYGSRSFSDRAGLLAAEIAMRDARAVVLWLTEEDESLAWDVVRQRAVLEQLQLPALILTRRHWDGLDGAVDEIVHFLEENKP